MISPLSFIVLPSRVILSLSKASSEYGHCDRQETATAGSRPVCPIVFRRRREKQETVADEATAALLTKLPFNSDLEKAKAAFSQAQAVEEKFHHDFDGVDFIDTSLCYGGA
jgi:hypothetical protein